MKVVAPLLIEFGPFRVDFSERLLLCNGKAVPLAPRVFETLVILLENRGHILEKDELIKRLWPDTFVEESNLAQNICQLRKALEIGACGREYIETIPKRGYRFAMDVGDIANADTRFVTSHPTNIACRSRCAARHGSPPPCK